MRALLRRWWSFTQTAADERLKVISELESAADERLRLIQELERAAHERIELITRLNLVSSLRDTFNKLLQ